MYKRMVLDMSTYDVCFRELYCDFVHKMLSMCEVYHQEYKPHFTLFDSTMLTAKMACYFSSINITETKCFLIQLIVV